MRNRAMVVGVVVAALLSPLPAAALGERAERVPIAVDADGPPVVAKKKRKRKRRRKKKRRNKAPAPQAATPDQGAASVDDVSTPAVAEPPGSPAAGQSETPPAPAVPDATPPAAPDAASTSALSDDEAAAKAARVAGAEPARVAVYDFEMTDIDPRLGRLVTESVLLEVRKLRAISAIGLDEVRAMLDHEANKEMLGCNEASCLADIAGALGVDYLLIGSMSRLGDEHIFGLRLIDQRNVKVIGQVTKRLKADGGEEFFTVVGPAVAELFPERQLRTGATRGVDEAVAAKLNPPPLSPLVFWSTAIGAGSVAGLGAVAGLFTAYAFVDYRLLVATGQSQVVKGEDIVLKERIFYVAAASTALLLVGAAAVGVAAAVTTPFTDWEGLGDEDGALAE